MAFVTISSADVAVDKPITNEWAETMIANDKDLNGRVGSLASNNVLNGDFEISDTSITGGAANWTVTLLTGGAATLSTAVSARGGGSLEIIHPGGAGNGGAEALSDHFAIEGGSRSYNIKFSVKQTIAAGISNSVSLIEYDIDKVDLSSTILVFFQTGAHTTDWQPFEGFYQPASNTRFIKIKLVGGSTVETNSATIYFDNVGVRPLSYVSPGTYVAKFQAFSVATSNAAGYIGVSGSSFKTAEDGLFVFRAVMDQGPSATASAQILRNTTVVDSLSFSSAITSVQSSYISGRAGDVFAWQVRGTTAANSSFKQMYVGRNSPEPISTMSTATSPLT